MTDFLIKSTIGMLAFFAIYRLFLEREKMHHFNRFYLLFTLAFSLVLPFISLTIYKEVAAEPLPILTNDINLTAFIEEVEEPVDYTTPILWAVYGIITLLMATKFVRNIYYFVKQARKNQSEKINGATLVLLEEEVIPHTFLNYIFVSKEDHDHNSIEQELYLHELTHVKQKHSYDILFIEVLKTIFWFNPLLYFYKKAIQLNHEFLADESVVTTSHNVVSYQQLLLQKAFPPTQYMLASSLNFSVTKKRFKMMTKATPKRKALLLKLAALPVIAGLVYALCTEVVAQATTIEVLEVEAIAVEIPNNNGKADPKRDSYYKGVQVIVLNEKREKIVDKPYEELTEAEKDQYLNPVPAPTQKKQISVKQYNDLKNGRTYGVWIDDKHIDNKELDAYKPQDFAFFAGSPVFKNVRSAKYPQPFQFHLYTHDQFEKTFKDMHKKFGGDTYIVALGSFTTQKEVKEADTKPEKVTGAYDDKAKNTKSVEIVTDTVKKTKERQEMEARRAIAKDARDKAMQRREEIISERNANSTKVLDNKHPERDRRRAIADSVKAEANRFKAINTQRLNPKNPTTYQEDKLYAANEVTVQPEYPGGMGEFYKFVNTNFTVPKEIKSSVKIYVSFIIEKDGSLSNIKVLRDPGYGAGDETVRVLKKSKNWNPGKVENKSMRTSYNLPIMLNVK